MRRLAHWFLALTALALTPLGASAQTGTTGTTTQTPTQAIQQGLVVKRAGKQLTNDPVIYVTKAHCDDNLEYEFSVRYTQTVPVAELWVGVGTEDCSTEASRTRASNTATQPVCWLAGNAGDTLNPVIRARAIDLFSSGRRTADVTETDAGSSEEMDAGAGDVDAGETEGGVEEDASVDLPVVPGTGSEGCDEAKNLDYKVYFLPLPQPTNVSGNKAYAPLPATSYGYSTLIATFKLYTELPASPTGERDQPGESQIGIGFDQIAGSPAKTTYRAYFDWGSSTDSECGSGALVAGQPPPEVGETITSVSAPSGTGLLKDLDARGITINTFVAAAAVTVDPAGNESLLGEPVCVERVETWGFTDRCEMDPDCKFHSCSLRPGARASGALALGALFVLGLVLFVRRRQV